MKINYFINTPKMRKYILLPTGKGVLVLLILVSMSFNMQAQEWTIFRNTYRMYETMRLSNGMYRDSKLLSGTDYYPVSVANVGVGLISLCIADAMGWDNNARQKALTTLKTITGNTSGFNPDRNASGYYRHFLDINNGSRAWNSEYSTIDTDILAVGAMFAKNYFKNGDISYFVEQLWNSIDFTKAIASRYDGRIFTVMNSNGNGNWNHVTYPYNEYMIVAWLAKNDKNHNTYNANRLWDKFYKNPNTNMPTNNYYGDNLLTDNPNGFLSSFTHQFNYYMCSYFTNSSTYRGYFDASRKADKRYSGFIFNNSYEWGNGAGSIPNGYHADAINNNPNKIVSPHIIGGYIPVYRSGIYDLRKLYNNNKGVFKVPGTNYKFLWRYGMDGFKPNDVQGIDLSSMLFGLAHYYRGSSFFRNNLVINLPKSAITVNGQASSTDSPEISLYPNPVADYAHLDYTVAQAEKVNITVFNLAGNEVEVWTNELKQPGTYSIEQNISSWAEGVYFVRLSLNNSVQTYKMIKGSAY